MRVINRIVPALYTIKAEYMTNKVYVLQKGKFAGWNGNAALKEQSEKMLPYSSRNEHCYDK